MLLVLVALFYDFFAAAKKGEHLIEDMYLDSSFFSEISWFRYQGQTPSLTCSFDFLSFLGIFLFHVAMTRATVTFILLVWFLSSFIGRERRHGVNA